MENRRVKYLWETDYKEGGKSDFRSCWRYRMRSDDLDRRSMTLKARNLRQITLHMHRSHVPVFPQRMDMS